MAFLSVEGARIAYEVIGGGGPWVTLINGHTRGKSDFKMLARKLAEKSRRVLILDNRGSGETQSDGAFTFGDFHQDILSLWKELEIEKTSLVGISMGGFIAQHIAHTANNIERLVLVSTAGKKGAISRTLPWSDDVSSVEKRLLQNFSKVFAENNRGLIAAMVKSIMKQINEGDFLKNAHAQDIATENFDVSVFTHRSTVPTMILHGEEDAVISVDTVRELSACYDPCIVKIIPDCGHLILAERPRELFSELDSFLEKGE